MKVLKTEIEEVLLIEPNVWGDERGFFFEMYNAVRYADVGIPAVFVQDNLSMSKAGVLRGLHAQNPSPQGKLVSCVQGHVYDVAVDIRAGSPTFGKWIGVDLTSDNKRQFWIPPGFAHGFAVLSDYAIFAYKVTDTYNSIGDFSVRWNDPEIGIEWPVTDPLLSAKDAAAPFLRDLDPARLVAY